MNLYYPVRYFGDVSSMMRDYVMERARQCLTRTASEKAALATVEQVKERQARVREAFLEALGGLPERSEELDPVWGQLRERSEYSVQNVMFKAAPEVCVTATVWRPIGWEGPRPGVLFPCGHHEYPREAVEYQETCAWFAVSGYVTLAFDPPGQGEQKLCWDPVLQASFAGTGSAEHEHCGLQCELLGHNIARYFVQYGMAAFDMLASLPEVDPARIAVTGNSGGGTQSSYLMLADERIAAGMPCTFTTDRWTYMQRPHWHDEEQNLTRSLSSGLDYDDFYFCFAPKPAAIGAVAWDFFPIEGTRLAYERIRHVYSLLGAEDRVALFEVEAPHSYNPVLRENAVRFFNGFLQPEAEFRKPGSFEPEPAELQRNARTGQVCTSIPGAKLAFEQHLKAVTQSRRKRHVPAREELVTLLGLPSQDCPLNPRLLDTREEEGLIAEKSFIVTELGIVVPVLRLAGPEPQAALIYCCDGGVQSISEPEERVLRQVARCESAAYLVDPRGIGETGPPLGPDESSADFLTSRWLPQHLRMLGTSAGGLRAYDLARTLEYVRAQLGEVPVTLMARGMVAWSAIIAAALDGKVEALCLHELRPSIEEFAAERTARVPQAYAIPEILQLAELPLLAQSAQVARGLILDPVDSLARPISETSWQHKYAATWCEAIPDLQVECHTNSLRRHAVIARFCCQAEEVAEQGK